MAYTTDENVHLSGSTTYYVGMGWVHNGHLYLRYACNPVNTTAKGDKALTFKYTIVKMSQEFCYPTQKLRKKIENLDFVILFFLHHT